MKRNKHSPIWNHFTEDQQQILNQYLHTPMIECPPVAQALKKQYWRLQKKRSRAFGELKKHENGAFGTWLKKNQLRGSDNYKAFGREGDPE